MDYARRKNALLRRIPAITYPTPTVTGMSPATLLTAGGETITLTGTGFRVRDGHNGYLNNVFEVRIGESYVGTSLSIASETSLSFVTPAMAAGTYPLWVHSNGGDGYGGQQSTTETFRILVETGDVLLAETGDALRKE